MLRIRLLRGGRIVERVDAKWTLNVDEIASEAERLESQVGADDWDLTNEADVQILTKARWSSLNHS